MKRSGFTLCAVVLVIASALLLTSKAGGMLLISFVELSAGLGLAPFREKPQAIVVLTGGDARTREAARQHWETGLPVLSSGGDGEAALLKKNLQNIYKVPVRWTEDYSLSTEQNAFFCAEILRRENLQNIILVTDRLHMWRAKMMFTDRGLKVKAAPADAVSRAHLQVSDFVPGKEGIKLTKSALHEIFGIVWYKSRRLFHIT